MSKQALNRARENVALLAALDYDKQQMKELIKRELMEFINQVEKEIGGKENVNMFCNIFENQR